MRSDSFPSDHGSEKVLNRKLILILILLSLIDAVMPIIRIPLSPMINMLLSVVELYLLVFVLIDEERTDGSIVLSSAGSYLVMDDDIGDHRRVTLRIVRSKS